jgi:hypothetical protein
MAVRDLIPRMLSPRMPVMRSESMNPLAAFHAEMNRLFDDFWREFDGVGTTLAPSSGFPRVEVIENERNAKVEAELLPCAAAPRECPLGRAAEIRKLEVLKMSTADTVVPFRSAPGAPAPEEALGLISAPGLSRASCRLGPTSTTCGRCRACADGPTACVGPVPNCTGADDCPCLPSLRLHRRIAGHSIWLMSLRAAACSRTRPFACRQRHRQH